jgi:outer membrane protein assembly factor BamB
MLAHMASSPRSKIGAMALTCAMAALTCGGGQTRGNPLDSGWSDEDGSELQAFQRKWQPPDAPSRPDVSVGVVNGGLLIGQSGQSAAWRFEHELEGRPAIAGPVVVAMGGGELFALDAENGELLWTRKALGELRGADDDGQTTIVSIASLSRKRSAVLAIARDGSVVRQIYERAVVGSPTVSDAFAFLPWNGKTVIIFDLLHGTEAARVVSSVPVSRAFMVGGELYFGESTALRFDDHIVAARRGGGTRVALPTRPFPGAPRWHLPSEHPRPLRAAHDDRIRYYARPQPVGRKAISIKRYTLAYERIAIGLAAPSAEVQWTYTSEDTFLGGSATADGVALCDAAGHVRWLDGESGALIHERALGERVVACLVQSERAPTPELRRARPPLEEQLLEAIIQRDARLLPIQLELLDDLAGIDGDHSTRMLVTLATQGPPNHRLSAGRAALQQRADELLVQRRNGANAMIQALRSARLRRPAEQDPRVGLASRQWRRLRARSQPPRSPIIALTTALLAMRDTRAALPLARLLLDPTLRPAAAEEISAAIRRLATILTATGEPTSEEDTLRRLLAGYMTREGCDPGDQRIVRALISVAHAVVALGGRDLVARLATDSCDEGPMRTSLQAAATATAP